MTPKQFIRHIDLLADARDKKLHSHRLLYHHECIVKSSYDDITIPLQYYYYYECTSKCKENWLGLVIVTVRGAESWRTWLP